MLPQCRQHLLQVEEVEPWADFDVGDDPVGDPTVYGPTAYRESAGQLLPPYKGRLDVSVWLSGIRCFRPVEGLCAWIRVCAE